MTHPPSDDSLSARPPGYRLPPTTHVGTVRLQVADLTRSVAWYERVLGVVVLRQQGSVASLGAAGGTPVLVELHERPGASAVPPRGQLGLFHFALLLPDEPALGRFVTHLESIGERAGASDHLVSEALYLRDPDGLGIEVYADRPRSTWQRQGRELRMDTRPLDLDRVVAAAGGTAWTGMPADTVMGHVHLQVGDVEASVPFYHAALGLDKTVWSYPGALFLSAGGYHHHLGVNEWAGPAARPAPPGGARLLEWTLVLPSPADVAAALASLAAGGYRADDGRVADPWGTVLHLMSTGQG